MPDRNTLGWKDFEATYIQAGKPSRIALGKAVHLDVAPASASMILRAVTGELPRSVAVPDYLSFRFALNGQDRVIELSCRSAPLFRPFYSLCLATSDLIDAGHTPSQAVEIALREWRKLLGSFIEDSETLLGLFGELIVLNDLAKLYGDRSLRCWTANKPGGSIHDFRLLNMEIEVKTTTRNTREHWISSLEQLIPSEHCTLYVASVHLQESDPGSGTSIGSVLKDICLRIPNHASSLEKLVRTRCGTLDPYQVDRSWVMRTPIQYFKVTDTFPRLSRDDIRRIKGHACSDKITEIKYLIALDGLHHHSDLVEFLPPIEAFGTD